MAETVWPSAQNIIDANGQVIQNPDGTISVYTYNTSIGQLTPQNLTKSWCDSLGIANATWNASTQQCNWSAIDCQSPFNIVLNSRGSDATSFSVYPDQTCSLSVDFDYLFKFDCATLTQLAAGSVSSGCNTIIDVFESLGASVILDIAPSQTSLTRVYQQQLFNTIGSGNLYNYLTSAGTNTGFYICGGSATNPNDTNCYPLNLFNLNASGTTINCGIVANQLITQLYAESGLSALQITAFTQNINQNAFGINWQHFHMDITDPVVISAISNQKIKLSIQVSGACVDTCVLLDNIVLNQNCIQVETNNLFLTQSPGFELDRVRDNKKSWMANSDPTQRAFVITNSIGSNPIRYTDYTINNSQQAINTKEIDLDINLAEAVETDVWNYITNNSCILTGISIGTTICVKNAYNVTTSACTPQTYCCSEYCGDANISINNMMTQPLSGVSTIEDFEYFITSELIDAKNRKTISSYPTLRLLYDRYLSSLNFCGSKSAGFDYFTMDTFANLVGNYWVDIIEQVIPATTIWGSTKIYTNTIFDINKYKYKAYSTLFGYNGSIPFVSSPATGITCNVSATTSVIEGTSLNTAAFFTQGQINNYSSVYVIQMNSGSEFYGTVSILGPNAPVSIVGPNASVSSIGSNNSTQGNSINECLIQVTISSVQPGNALSNGSLTANVSGSNGPVKFLWSNGATTQTISNLPAEIYSVTVTDTSMPSCTAYEEIYLTALA